jgi:hypothetical protein
MMAPRILSSSLTQWMAKLAMRDTHVLVSGHCILTGEAETLCPRAIMDWDLDRQRRTFDNDKCKDCRTMLDLAALVRQLIACLSLVSGVCKKNHGPGHCRYSRPCGKMSFGAHPTIHLHITRRLPMLVNTIADANHLGEAV